MRTRRATEELCQGGVFSGLIGWATEWCWSMKLPLQTWGASGRWDNTHVPDLGKGYGLSRVGFVARFCEHAIDGGTTHS